MKNLLLIFFICISAQTFAQGPQYRLYVKPIIIPEFNSTQIARGSGQLKVAYVFRSPSKTSRHADAIHVSFQWMKLNIPSQTDEANLKNTNRKNLLSTIPIHLGYTLYAWKRNPGTQFFVDVAGGYNFLLENSAEYHIPGVDGYCTEKIQMNNGGFSGLLGCGAEMPISKHLSISYGLHVSVNQVGIRQSLLYYYDTNDRLKSINNLVIQHKTTGYAMIHVGFGWHV